MKIVIDIPNSAYEEICSGKFDVDGYFKANLRDAFKNGTPLSEGCERLISANEFKKAYTTTKMNEGIHRIIYEKIIDGTKTTIEGYLIGK